MSHSKTLNYLISALVLGTLSLPVMAQAADHPDFTGVWQAYGSEPRFGVGGEGALTEQGAALVDSYFSQYGDDFAEPGSYCVPPGLASTMTSMVSYPIEVIHSQDRVTILLEYDMQVRRIFMDGRDVPSDHPVTRMGYSTGHWEGDELVIETELLSDWLMRSWPRSENTTVVERVYSTTREDAGVAATGFVQASDYDEVLVFELTVTDSTLYKEPQNITMYYQKIPDDSFLEYDCPADLWRRALEGRAY